MGRRFRLEGENAARAEKMLGEVADVFERHGVRYSLTAGTLLGVVREDRLLPWDQDLDLTVFYDELPQLRAALDEVRRSGYVVRTAMQGRDDPPLRRGQTRIIKIYNRRFLFFRGRFRMDCFVKVKEGDRYYWAVGVKNYAKKAIAARFYDSMEAVDFRGRRYPVPGNPREYLRLRYGADWEVPKKQWHFARDDLAIIPSATGEEAAHE